MSDQQTQNDNENVMEFIQLVKCVIEYYGVTKKKNAPKEEEANVDNSLESQLQEATRLLSSMDEFNLDDITVDIPDEIDEAVKKAFLSQLNRYSKTEKKTKLS